MKVLIVGGVAGGASTAARLRRLDEKAEIIIFEKSSYISYANCGLPYYIGNVITEEDKLFLQTPESMKERFNIDVRVNAEVVNISRDEKEIEVLNLKDNSTYRESYDKLVLSPGAAPIKPKIPGIDESNVFTLRRVEDTFAIKEFIRERKPEEAVIVGGGYIGIEMAENLKKVIKKVTIVELSNQVFGVIDREMASIVHQKLESEGVELILEDGVKSISNQDNNSELELNSGKRLKADLIIMSAGVKPDAKLAREAGLEIDSMGGIVVDKFMKTSDPDIYAVGDAVEVTDLTNKNQALIPLAGPANKQGRIAADNIAGRNEEYKGTLGTSIAKVFDMTVASVGNSEKILKKYNIEYEKIYIHPPSHAGYYPDAVPMTLKLIFDKNEGKILGAQIIGYDGVDKRIDVIATAMKAGMTVRDLQELELAYAPPYSSAKDPVNMAGYAATNVLDGESRVIHWDDIDGAKEGNSILIDVRTPSEFSMGYIEGAVNIPIDQFRERINEVPKDKRIVLYCQVGARGYFVERLLRQNGYTDIVNLSGGYKTYITAYEKLPQDAVENGSSVIANNDLRASECTSDECKADVKIKVDACGIQCPGPIMKVNQAIAGMTVGEVLEVRATDMAFENDVKAWCRSTGNTFLKAEHEKGIIKAYVKKGVGKVETTKLQGGTEKTMVVFSGDLDKAIAAFIIANGAAAMGSKVTMFFTFWGLNIIRREQNVGIKKNFLERSFGIMMPRGANRLKLSNMNMGGMGAKLIRHIMKTKHVDSLGDLIEKAKEQGIKLVACSMSMDVMGLRQEEFIDGVEVGGVAYFLDSADRSNMSLFI